MEPELSHQAEELCRRALELDESQRAAFLEQACGGDDRLRGEVESLLAHDKFAERFMESPQIGLEIGLGRVVSRDGEMADEHLKAHATHTPLLRPGTLLASRFKIKRFVAHGGMGELYEAEDLELHGSLAIKTLRPEILEQPRAIDRFKREVHLARKVTHPNVCRVFDLFRDQSDGQREIVFVTMEYLQGETLADRMKAAGPISTGDCLPLVRQIASALGAAHEAGIVHRDFKPGNVMLVNDSAGQRVVVTDFGLAFRGTNQPPGAGQDATWNVSSAGGALYGTLAYMAPEQLEGKPATEASDIYALGIVMYEMVTGTRPFTGDTPMAAAVKRIVEPPPSPRNFIPKIDPVWEQAILLCLERQPERRLQSTQALIAALDGETPIEVQSGKSGRAHHSVSKDWPVSSQWQDIWRSILLVGITVIALASMAVGYWYYRRMPAHPVPISVPASAVVHLRPAIAVLGFKNLSGKASADWLSTAFAETLNTELALGEVLRTIPGENIARIKLALALPDADSYSKETLGRIRENMNADIVILGSYLDAGGQSGRVRIDLRAQDTKTGNIVAVVSESGTEAQVLDLISRTGIEVRKKLGAGVTTPAYDNAARTSQPSSPQVARLYSEGIKKLWLYDSSGAKADLERVVAEEPAFSLGHDALARAWSNLGFMANAKQESEKAFNLSQNLPREQRLSVEGHFREIHHQWAKAIDIYSTLFNFFPDSLEYGLAKARVERLGGKEKEALQTIQTLRSLPAPARNDPRIDIAESQVSLVTGDYRREEASAEIAEQKGKNLQAPQVVANADLLKCGALERLGEIAQAIANCRAAGQAYAQAGDRGGQGRALINLGIALSGQGDNPGDQKSQQQALEIFKSIGDRTNEALALNNLAVDVSSRGDHLSASRMYEQALAINREIDNKPNMLSTMTNISQQLMMLGNLAGAATEYRQAMSLSREIGDMEDEAQSGRGLAATLLLQGNLPGAEKAANETIRICQSIGSKSLLADSKNDFGNLISAEGKIHEAEDSFKESIRLFTELGNGVSAAESGLGLASVYLDENRPGEAETLIRQSLAVFQKANVKDLIAFTNAMLARALLAQGKTEEAGRAMNSVALDPGGDISIRFEVTLSSVSVKAASPKAEDQRAARQSIESLIAETTRLGYKPYEFESRLSLGEIEMKNKQAEEGRRTLAAVEKDARSKGFVQIAAEAAKAMKS